ncbi:MAG: PKD domain-containing protein [bacterium]
MLRVRFLPRAVPLLLIAYAALIFGCDVEGSAASTNAPPTADAGPDRMARTGTNVILDGSWSADPDRDPLGYEWTLLSVPAGSRAHLDAPHLVDPIFTADVSGEYLAQLIVTDGDLEADPDTVTITVSERGAPTREQPIGSDGSGNRYGSVDETPGGEPRIHDSSAFSPEAESLNGGLRPEVRQPGPAGEGGGCEHTLRVRDETRDDPLDPMRISASELTDAE